MVFLLPDNVSEVRNKAEWVQVLVLELHPDFKLFSAREE